jgi:transposase-like protein
MEHVCYEKHSSAGYNSGNSRKGTTPKTLRGKRGQVHIDVPRDRNAEFKPQLVKKNQTRFNGLDEKFISLYLYSQYFLQQRELSDSIHHALISRLTENINV